MTVKELIEKLQEFDPSAKVHLETFTGYAREVESVYSDYDGTIIISQYGEE